MTYRVAPQGQRAFCDRCLLVTPRMHAASIAVAAQILRAAGWHAEEADDITYCPRCRTLFARREPVPLAAPSR